MYAHDLALLIGVVFNAGLRRLQHDIAAQVSSRTQDKDLSGDARAWVSGGGGTYFVIYVPHTFTGPAFATGPDDVASAGLWLHDDMKQETLA